MVVGTDYFIHCDETEFTNFVTIKDKRRTWIGFGVYTPVSTRVLQTYNVSTTGVSV